MKTKKRALSLLIAFSMIMSLIPTATIIPVAAAGESYAVQLMGRSTTGSWETNDLPYKSQSGTTAGVAGDNEGIVVIDGNTPPGQVHKLKIDHIGDDNLINLSLRPVGSTWCDENGGCGGMGGWKPEVGECSNCHATWGDFIAPGYLDANGDDNTKGNQGRFENAVIKFTKVTINGNINALEDPATVPFLSQHRFDRGHANADLWAGWYGPRRLLSSPNIFTKTEGTEGQSFWLKNEATINSIEVEFKVYLVDDVYPVPEKQRENNGISVFLASREALDWRSGGTNFWKSDSQRIDKDGIYEMEINFNRSGAPAPVDRLASLAIMSYGSTFDEGIGFLLNARQAPESWRDDEVLIEIKEVKINDELVANKWGVEEYGGNKDLLVSQGNAPTDEFVNVELWNAWFSDNRKLDVSASSPLFTTTYPKGQGSSNPPHGDWPDADKEAVSFALDNKNLNNPIITKAYVKFEITGVNREMCATHANVVGPTEFCYLCNDTFCKNGCGMPAVECSCPACGVCGAPMPCKDHKIEWCPFPGCKNLLPCPINHGGSTTPPPPPLKCEAGPGKTPCLEYDCPICNKDKEWSVLGDILGNGDITIFDAMEILMFLVKVSDCVILKGNDDVTAEQAKKAAIISPEGFEAGEPTIFCFIEVLLYLVKMPDIAITGKHIAPAPKGE
ncbi:MAG: hypothetical protein FWF94_01455 [Oscillospiraceae bacterium]|nr:hypothetical protein [Oscillospiraceae bacterium]